MVSSNRRGAASVGLLAALSLQLPACAIHYFDAETGVEHVFGVGHMAAKVERRPDEIDAIGRKAEVVGVALGIEDDAVYLQLGWSARERLEILSPDTQFCLLRPTASLFNARVGSAHPSDDSACIDALATDSNQPPVPENR